MKPNILTRERLTAIEKSIDEHGGSVTIRHLMRNHGYNRHIIDEAVNGGYLILETLKPKQGRPSLIVKKVNESYPTKLPPRRSWLDHCISYRQWDFAFWYVMGELGPGMFSFRRRAWFAYMKCYPSVKTQASARAGASRLMKKPKIRAVITWTFAKHCDPETDCEGLYPSTAEEIWDTLRHLENWRIQGAPLTAQLRWINEDCTTAESGKNHTRKI